VTASLLHLELILFLDDRLLLLIVVLLLLLLSHNLLLLALLLLLLLLLFLGSLLSCFSLLTLLLFSLLAFHLFLLDTLLLALLLSSGLLFLFGLFSFILLAKSLLLGSFLICVIFLSIFLALFFGSDAEDLHHVGCGVNTSGCGSEHLLEEIVGLLGFVSRDNLSGLAVNLLSNDELGQLNKFEEPVDLGILISDRFTVEFLTLVESISEASDFDSGGEDVVDVTEWGFAEELLGHLGFLDELLVHLRSFLPIVVFSHLKIV